MADATDSKSVVPCGHEGSSPSSGTIKEGHPLQVPFLYQLMNTVYLSIVILEETVVPFTFARTK